MMKAGYLYALCAIGAIYSSNGQYTWAILIIALFYFFPRANGMTVSLCLLTFVFFYVYYQVADGRNVTLLSGQEEMFIGKVESVPDINGDLLSFRLQMAGETVIIRQKISSQEQQESLRHRLKAGMTCRIQGKLDHPPGQENFAGMNYSEYLRKQGIHWLVTGKALMPNECTQPSASLFNRLSFIRSKGVQFIEHSYPVDISGLLNALVFGYRDHIPDKIEEAYQRLGLSHLLAVSGLNVAILCGMLFVLLLRAGVTREQAAVCIAAVLPFYIFLTGGGASIVRAGMMGTCLVLLQRYRTKMHPLSIISCVCLVMLLINPYYAFQLGFQLSFLNVFALMVSSRFIFSRYSSYWSQIFISSLICQMISFPLIINSFYEVSLWSLPLNLLFIPLLSIIALPSASLGVFFSFFSVPLAKLLFYPAVLVLQFTNQVLFGLDHEAFAVTFGKPPLLLLPLYYAGIIYFLICFEKGGLTRALLPPVLCLLSVGIFHWNIHLFDNKGRVTYLNVGQGDSTLIELPLRKQVYLIDTGGTIQFQTEAWKKRRKEYNVTKEVVLTALKSRGIRKIDKLILTHGDMDHIGGAQTLLSGIKVKEVLFPKGMINEPLEKRVLHEAAKRHLPITVKQRGRNWSAGGGEFQVLSPYGDETESNARSIVIWAQMSSVSFLFTGDLEEPGEQRILSEGQPLGAIFLKAGHHGSKTSSSAPFIDQVKPSYAIFSAGKNNRYGHPHPEVVSRFIERGVRILRTDQQGDVEIMVSEGSWKVRSSVNASK
ncbi:DNA internalization-related competence protein ComEC/Rec2 [Fictibacillus fluitans]|uniref:DNA internalization-related competence protein ComEC/Rec2 n=1 Tax=Fictibacillus fluitans TaxID=3058422 RepID=A0ABT8HXI1_9BACL|nr:DNA internalization-related competence protein ComEC/Rec2 [Fictibacillus sp. NE201]MDN4525458.1 DNA internalization-related competence protein ComEC/Rec2 [Fictibacillus sp. NE201]